MTYRATKHRVHDRGVPPDRFLDELVAWGRTAPAEIFAPSPATDVYTSVFKFLGPWRNNDYRRAAMLEILRVLAGFESSWNWNCGRDTNNKSSITATTIEAGAFQVSADSIGFGADLKKLVLARVGSVDGNAFQKAMKKDHVLAMEYSARLLRHTVAHHGPVVRHEIDAWLRKDSVEEFLTLMAQPASPVAPPAFPPLRDGSPVFPPLRG